MKYLVTILVFVFGIHLINLIHQEWVMAFCGATPTYECSLNAFPY